MQVSKILLKGLLCLVFLGQTFWVPLLAQSSLSGTVFNSSGTVVQGASLLLKPSTVGTTSDENGNFRFEKLKPGKYKLEVSALGFQKRLQEIQIENKSTLTIYLLEETQALDEVQVIGKSEVQRSKEQEFTVNAIEVKQLANTTADLNQVLNRSTGVRIREQGGMGSDFNFSINGLSGKAIKFFIDGVPLEAMGSNITLNVMPVNLAERVEVYKGVVPVTLGSDALGGAVNVITNQNIGQFLDASYSFGSFGSHRVAVTAQTKHSRTGLVLKGMAFYNQAANNYKMYGVEVYDPDQKRYVEKNFNRFHDNFQSAMMQLEAGVMDKKWADVLLVGAAYSFQNKDLQTGATQKTVYGKVEQKGSALNLSIRYRKDNLFVKNLNLSVFASTVADRYRLIDTSYRKYYWDQSFIETTRSEISGGARSIAHFERPKTVVRANLSYTINDIHSLNLNYTMDRYRNRMYNELIQGDTTNDLMAKHILGFAYQQQFFGGRWANTFFGKYYGVDMAVEQTGVYYTGEGSNANGQTHNYGYGIASRLKLSADAGLKASYEKAYRLQTGDEMLGNGSTVVPNFNLIPENSNNVNIGAFWGKRLNGGHRVFVEGAGFYRNVRDFIYSVVIEALEVSQYQNTSHVKVTGFEGELKYSYARLLEITLNGSYQNAVNTTKNDERGTPEITYLNRVPNQPWFFGNFDFQIGKNDILGKGTRLQFNWYSQYVHWFYLTWEAFGTKQTKPVIPTQFNHNAIISYSLKDGRYNISVEGRNITNNLLYDNFRLQKPGRAINLKFRYFLK